MQKGAWERGCNDIRIYNKQLKAERQQEQSENGTGYAGTGAEGSVTTKEHSPPEPEVELSIPTDNIPIKSTGKMSVSPSFSCWSTWRICSILQSLIKNTVSHLQMPFWLSVKH